MSRTLAQNMPRNAYSTGDASLPNPVWLL